jgi:excisionase family DNA binding protein
MIRGSRPILPPLTTAVDEAARLEPLTVRVSTAVKLTGLSRSRIYELIQSGDLEVKKIGRSTLIPYPALKRLVTSKED